MITTDVVPAWFKRTPLFAQLETSERASAEAKRSVFAKERAQILAAETKAGPPRERAMTAAQTQLIQARAMYDVALADFERAKSEYALGSTIAGGRVATLERELTALAHPAITSTLSRLQNMHDTVRRSNADDAITRLTSVRAAQHDARALLLRADIDAPAELTVILARIDGPGTELPRTDAD